MSTKPHLYTMLIKENLLDTFGHVNNANYLVMLEEARWDLITLNGYGIERIKACGIGPVLLEINLAFSRELKLRETVTIETRVTSCTKKIFTMAQRILRGDDVCCTAELKLALFDLNQRKIIELTPEWIRAINTEGTSS